MSLMTDVIDIENNKEVGYGGNNMPALLTSSSNNLNFFAAVGGMRGKEEAALSMFKNAYSENKCLALANLLNCRDPRNGLGERSLSNYILRSIMIDDQKTFISLLPIIPAYGRWKDVFDIIKGVKLTSSLKYAIVDLIVSVLKSEDNSLLAKYVQLKPKDKTIQGVFSLVRVKMNMSPKEFRKFVVESRNGLVEVKMSSKRFGEIEYSNVPSMAMFKYNKAFYRQDGERFVDYIEDVTNGDEKINSSVLTPSDIADKIYKHSSNRFNSISSVDDKVLDTMWFSLKNHFDGLPEGCNILPVIDVSGSMDMAGVMGAAVGLGIYIAERNTGGLRNYACSFSENPNVFKVCGGNIKDKVNSVANDSNVGYGTNFRATIEKLAHLVADNNIKDEDEPKVLLFLSDMNFDESLKSSKNKDFESINVEVKSVSQVATDIVLEVYSGLGLKAPKIVFWNLNHNGTYAAGSTTDGFAMVSGRSASQIKGVLKNIDSFNPLSVMMETLEPYKNVVVDMLD